jgi:multidrug efflux pump
MYLFLENVRATLIPTIVVPVALFGAMIGLNLMGYSINVLTLLGLVLAIGLVVDDSIVVLENIYRRMEGGEPPLVAAVDGSREIGFAVIATTLVLISVFVPISFLQGNVGKLFREFGITVAAAVAFSSLVALTLTPMLSSKLLAGGATRSWLSNSVDAFFHRLSTAYDKLLRRLMKRPWLVIGATFAAMAVAVLLFRALPSELTPPEDRGMMFIGMTGPEGASLDYMDRHARMAEEILLREVEGGEVVRANIRIPGGFGGADLGDILGQMFGNGGPGAGRARGAGGRGRPRR